MDKVPMTLGGYRRLSEELKTLKMVERPAVIAAIAQAREHGDLAENAEYHAAKDQQGFIEARILDIEDKVSRADVIDVAALNGDTVKFGATVLLADMDTDEESTYQIVGVDESDVGAGLLSISSPLARALIGRAEGDAIEVQTPRGEKSYEIVTVKYI